MLLGFLLLLLLGPRFVDHGAGLVGYTRLGQRRVEVNHARPLGGIAHEEVSVRAVSLVQSLDKNLFSKFFKGEKKKKGIRVVERERERL